VRAAGEANRAAHPAWGRVFAVPIFLAAGSGIGFVAAFLWGDLGRAVCWLGVGLPLLVIAGFAIGYLGRSRQS
jgi:hypothetical protein